MNVPALASATSTAKRASLGLLVAGLAALLVGCGTPVEETEDYKALQSRMDNTTVQLEDAEGELANATGRLAGTSGKLEETAQQRAAALQEVKAAENDLADMRASLDKALAEQDDLRTELRKQTAQIEARADQLNALADELDVRDRQQDARQRALDARATELADQAKAVEALNTFPGDGTYLVGTDVNPGQYVAGGSNCSWALKADATARADTISTSSPGRQQRVSLSDGQLFGTSNCGQWSRTD